MIRGGELTAGQVARHHARRGVTIRKPMLILGTEQLAKDLLQVLTASRTSRYAVVGLLAMDGAPVDDSRILGTISQLFPIAERYHVTTIAVCVDDRRGGLPVQTLLDFKAMGIEVVDGHHLYESEMGRLSIDSLRPSSLIFSTGFRRWKVTMAVKRIMDLAIALVALVVLAPLYVLIALLIKLDSRGPVLYRQTRVGLNGKPYVIWKFRSMQADAEVDGARWASPADPRVTGVGRILRRWRLDELPQLFNVLKGDMSLVGPRPERPVFEEKIRDAIPYYDLRYTVRPGLTGWAQIRYRYASSAQESHVKLQYDLYYVKNFSIALDAQILVETIRVVLRGEGAR